ncbi:GAF domain-containing protein [Methanosarcina sp. DH1]|uniref:GAF domain-containing protein n=1 Tax=Methanosarcina sp. DH1 TaxID=2605695 RepID=UPI001E5B0C68|nr:GAF domain-containing protein [Methanosarcina sp. DH1]MCC4767158.1 GAF domain-containing protein [Methanosarcina sp. DH1]
MNSRYTTSQESTMYQALLDENKLLADENNALKEEVQSLRACLAQAEGLEQTTGKIDPDYKQVETTYSEREKQLMFGLDAMTRLHKIGTLFVREGNLEPVLVEIVDAAIAISGADFGNIQLLDPESSELKIVASRGFPKWWLDFWNSVSVGKGTCGTALGRKERVIVEDVEQSPIFVGTPALEIQLKAGIRAVQSTPIVSRSGKPLGMFSTQYKKPHKPDKDTLQMLDLLALSAADIIERASI